jgi:hypothetical protein
MNDFARGAHARCVVKGGYAQKRGQFGQGGQGMDGIAGHRRAVDRETVTEDDPLRSYERARGQ